MLTYKYCGYWRTWNRLLYSGKEGFVELNLTPINGFANNPSRLDDVRLEVIRFHFTSPESNDKITQVLPDKILLDMFQYIGTELSLKLLEFDYMSTITLADIKTAQQYTNGGGVPYKIICQVHNGEEPERHHWK